MFMGFYKKSVLSSSLSGNKDEDNRFFFSGLQDIMFMGL